MEIPGLDTILYESARKVWIGERAPSDALVRLIDDVTNKLKHELIQDAADVLLQIASFRLEPSQVMRLRFLQGLFLAESHRYAEAYKQYYEALAIAETHDDLDSQIMLTYLAGQMMYGLMKNVEALAYFQQALARWHVRAAQLRKPRAEPEVTLQERIGTVQWIIGDIDSARGTLARTLTLALYKRGVPHSDFIRRKTAGALWSLGLALRSQSDVADGSVNHLRLAIKRMKQAANTFTVVKTYNTNMGRLYIQIAELYLDLAEAHLQDENDDAASASRKQALHMLNLANDFIDPAIDVSGVLLVKLARLRYAITTRADLNAVDASHEIATQMPQIKRQAKRLKDVFTLAKVAMLRGEWLLWLGRTGPAKLALQESLTYFQSDGMGMATRAQRLMRRTEWPGQPARRRSNGPVPPTKSSAPPDGGNAPV